MFLSAAERDLYHIVMSPFAEALDSIKSPKKIRHVMEKMRSQMLRFFLEDYGKLVMKAALVRDVCDVCDDHEGGDSDCTTDSCLRHFMRLSGSSWNELSKLVLSQRLWRLSSLT